VRGTIDYEAQAAIELEMLAPDDLAGLDSGVYPFSIAEEESRKVVKLAELVSAVVAEVKNGAAASSVSARFHRTMAQIIARMCQLIAPESKTSLVVLSGGVFQNRLLSRLAADALQKKGFQVITHRLVPCNDGGISLGQAIIAHFGAS
jgi:hydrogenase maturation protein HypF